MPQAPGCNVSRQRSQMVEWQLKARGIADVGVLQTMESVPREEFVPKTLREFAFQDSALLTAHDQTISQPYTVAFMCEAVLLTGAEKVLEVGTGSGYAACVLARLAEQVFSIERILELAAVARRRIAALDCRRRANRHTHWRCTEFATDVPFHSPQRRLFEGRSRRVRFRPVNRRRRLVTSSPWYYSWISIIWWVLASFSVVAESGVVLVASSPFGPGERVVL